MKTEFVIPNIDKRFYNHLKKSICLFNITELSQRIYLLKLSGGIPTIIEWVENEKLFLVKLYSTHCFEEWKKNMCTYIDVQRMQLLNADFLSLSSFVCLPLAS